MRDAAEKEVPIAYAPLGLMYAEGLGVVKDYTEAGKWLRKGVQHGDPEAKGYLGMLQPPRPYTGVHAGQGGSRTRRSNGAICVRGDVLSRQRSAAEY